jgi:hypothetical protein
MQIDLTWTWSYHLDRLVIAISVGTKGLELESDENTEELNNRSPDDIDHIRGYVGGQAQTASILNSRTDTYQPS